MKVNLLLSILLVCFSSASNAKFLNLSYDVISSAPVVGIGIGKFSISGLTKSQTFSSSDLEISASRTDIRLDFWTNAAFMDGWYFGAAMSTVNVDMTYTSSSTNLTTFETTEVEFEGTGKATGTLFYIGYHWQWSYLNISLGAFGGTYNTVKFELESDAGDTEEQSAPISGSGAELRIGLAF
jgi:hypothetical protein